MDVPRRYYGTKHIFTNRTGNSSVNIKAGSGESLNLTADFVTLRDGAESTSVGSGSLIDPGGFGLGKSLNIGGYAHFDGSITSGSTSVTNLEITNGCTCAALIVDGNGSFNIDNLTSTTVTTDDATISDKISVLNLNANQVQIASSTSNGILVYNDARIPTFQSTFIGFDAPIGSFTTTGDSIRCLGYNNFHDKVDVRLTTDGTRGVIGSVVCRGGLGTPGSLLLDGDLYCLAFTGIQPKIQAPYSMAHSRMTGTFDTAISNSTGIVTCSEFQEGNNHMFAMYSGSRWVRADLHDLDNDDNLNSYIINQTGYYKIVVCCSFKSDTIIAQFCRFTVKNTPNTFTYTQDVYNALAPATKEKTFSFIEHCTLNDKIYITAQALASVDNLSYFINNFSVVQIY